MMQKAKSTEVQHMIEKVLSFFAKASEGQIKFLRPPISLRIVRVDFFSGLECRSV